MRFNWSSVGFFLVCFFFLKGISPVAKLAMAKLETGDLCDSLYDSKDLQLWSASYHCYREVVKEIVAQKSKKSSKSKAESLVELDNW